jgi:hypothetical protein
MESLDTAAPTWSKKDEAGNEVYIQNTGAYLKLVDAEKGKRIATIDTANKRILFNKESFDVFKSSYGFNYELLRVAQICDTVRLTCPEGKFDIPIKDILLLGDLKNGMHGIETMTYYSIADLKRFKIH